MKTLFFELQLKYLFVLKFVSGVTATGHGRIIMRGARTTVRIGSGAGDWRVSEP